MDQPWPSKNDQMVAYFQSALAKNPQDASAYLNMGLWSHWEENYAAALEHYNQAIQLSPTYSYALCARASLRATCPLPAWRDGAAAVQDAQTAIRCAEQSGEIKDTLKQRLYLQVLAAAHAECREFDKAVAAQTAALELAVTNRSTNEMQGRLRFYREGSPLRKADGMVHIGSRES